MYQYQCLNAISEAGLSLFSEDYQRTEEMAGADAVLLRSASLHETVFPEKLKAIARAGAGVNNIPLEDCAEKGIVVFNTPGANANGVKELVIAGMLLALSLIHIFKRDQNPGGAFQYLSSPRKTGR